jgi:glycosyltransferase involved in cell wall biosynthesis
VSEEEYIELLQRAKLVVCTESYGCETWRQYEVAAAGAVPVINYPFVLHYQPMEPDEHAIYFSLAGRDFEKQIERGLKNPALLQAISLRTRAWTLAHKTRPGLADYVIEETLREHRRAFPSPP